MTTTFKDPVCGMDVAPESAAGTSKYKDQTYYFCSPGCKKSFDKEPEKYVGEGEHTHHHQPTSSLPSWPVQAGWTGHEAYFRIDKTPSGKPIATIVVLAIRNLPTKAILLAW